VIIKVDVQEGGKTACDFLAARSGLSKSRIKEAMKKGAIWLKKKKGGFKRLRRASLNLVKGDRIEMHYDEKVLSTIPPVAECLADRGGYSVWQKPAGMMAQGTMYGDHCSLLRTAELFYSLSREVFLVHRLDREASGIMLIAHNGTAAAALSGLFQKNMITKKYRAEVFGDLGGKGRRGLIDFLLDGKTAITEYQVLSYDPGKGTSEVEVLIKTGRLHQIRRHFDMIGHPVIGDPRYGKENKNADGMKLTAVSLRFICPVSKKEVEFLLPG